MHKNLLKKSKTGSVTKTKRLKVLMEVLYVVSRVMQTTQTHSVGKMKRFLNIRVDVTSSNHCVCKALAISHLDAVVLEMKQTYPPLVRVYKLL
jgi:hypothetical protein